MHLPTSHLVNFWTKIGPKTVIIELCWKAFTFRIALPPLPQTFSKLRHVALHLNYPKEKLGKQGFEVLT